MRLCIEEEKQLILSIGSALSLWQWLLRSVYPRSTPDCPTVLEDSVSTPQSGSVLIVWCYLNKVIMPQGVS
ncbi:hypothetical protein TNCV_4529251 [Trichonephila clavipes]|uniref:Uncharacterized protein n=1 Tax=Trichonephila clavipes TaxID=2585209 RepID=A0A8X6S2M9_TRICX|nr:hypothetical protein TNCV_4529251 [Trichonephila clavipes]